MAPAQVDHPLGEFLTLSCSGEGSRISWRLRFEGKPANTHENDGVFIVSEVEQGRGKKYLLKQDVAVDEKTRTKLEGRAIFREGTDAEVVSEADVYHLYQTEGVRHVVPMLAHR